MRAVDVMVRDVITVTPDTGVSETARLLVDHDISAVPVVDGAGRMIGIVSEADLIRRDEIDTEKRRPRWLEAVTPATELAEEYARSRGKKVGDVMSTELVTADEDASLGEIATLLERHRIKRVPIVRDGRLVGIVSRTNLIQALASVAQPPADSQPDRLIRTELLNRLAKQRWTDFGSRNVIVTDGTVHLWGLVGSPEERRALLALAGGVPGVSSVADEMIPAYS
jgi:CBS-domain-containing membrane protein